MEKNRAGSDPVRLSAAGYCQRKLWYKKHHPSLSTGYGTRMIDSFAVGDAVEQVIKLRLNEIYGTKYRGFTLICRGCKTERKQYTLDCLVCGSHAFDEIEDKVELAIDLPDGGVSLVPGRPDGILDCPDGVTRLVEIKTMANYTYGMIKGNGASGEIGYDYACQATAYLTAFGLEETLFIPIRKETGEVCFRYYKREPVLLKEVERRFANVISSKPEKPLPRDYAPKVSKSPKGCMELTFPCSYCEFAKSCYPTFITEFKEKKDYGTGSVNLSPTAMDRTGRFKTPEEAQLHEEPFVMPKVAGE